jgi:hypothetical protein
MRRAARIDGNHVEVVSALRKIGCSVASLAAVGKGVPDLLVAFHGVNYLIEVKVPGGKLTPDQERFFGEWKGQRTVVLGAQEAVNYMIAAEQMRCPR